MARGKARPSQKFLLPNGIYVIVYFDDQTPNMKIGGIDRDLVVKDNSASTDGSRILVDVSVRPDAKSPRIRGNDVDVALLMERFGLPVTRR